MNVCGLCGRQTGSSRLFGWPTLFEAHARPPAILIDEFDAGCLQCTTNGQIVGRRDVCSSVSSAVNCNDTNVRFRARSVGTPIEESARSPDFRRSTFKAFAMVDSINLSKTIDMLCAILDISIENDVYIGGGG